MNLYIKKLHPDAKIPEYATSGSAGLDLTAVTVSYAYDYTEYDTGLSVEIPEGHVGLIFPRSSISNTKHILSNAVGVCDSDYRGSIKFRFKTLGHLGKEYEIGDRIGQLVVLPYPKMNIVEVSNLSTTERGTGGYGSTGA